MLNKIVIFDFDDTLFPTTHVITTKSFTEEEINKINESIKQLFENLWERNYKIIIITNAELEWIKTWKEYIPILNEVDIYSARDKYEKKNIPQNNWKKLLYLNLFTKKLLNYTGKVIYQTSNEANYLTDNPNRRCPIIAKAKEKLEYNPTILVDKGVERFLRFLIEERVK